jgi:hypothetical protein
LYDASHTNDVRSFTEHCVEGIRADEKRIRDLMELALMLVRLRFVSSTESDRLRSDKMTHPG